MSYPTNVVDLLNLTEDEWEALLASVWNAPVPRQIVRLGKPKAARKPSTASLGRPKKGDEPRAAEIAERRRKIFELSATGLSQAAVARELGISQPLVWRVLTGVAN